jgi:hypothetical protein
MGYAIVMPQEGTKARTKSSTEAESCSSDLWQHGYILCLEYPSGHRHSLELRRKCKRCRLRRQGSISEMDG